MVLYGPFELRSVMYTSFEDLLATSKYGFFNKMTTSLVCYIVFLLGGATVTFLATCLSGVPSLVYYQRQDVDVFVIYNCIFIGQILGYLSLGCLVDIKGRLKIMNIGLLVLPLSFIGLVLATRILLCYAIIIASSALLTGLHVASRIYFVEYSFVETRGRSYMSLTIAFCLGSTSSLLLYLAYPSLLFRRKTMDILIAFATVLLFLFQVSQFLHPSLRYLIYQRQRIAAYLRHIYTLNTREHEKDYKIPRHIHTRKLIEQINLTELLSTSPQVFQLKTKIVHLFSREYLKQTLCFFMIASVVWLNAMHNDFMLLMIVIYKAARSINIGSQVRGKSHVTRQLMISTTSELMIICAVPVLIILILRPITDVMKRKSMLSSLVLANASLQCLLYSLIRTNTITRTVFIVLMCLKMGLTTMSSALLELIVLENLPTKIRAVGFSIFKTMGSVTFMILFDTSLISEEHWMMINVMLLLFVLFPITAINDQSGKPMLEFVKKESATPVSSV